MNKLLFQILYLRYHGKDGVPHIRDFNSPCHDFEYGKRLPFADCGTDGHYLCGECRNQRLAYDCPTDCKNLLDSGGPWDNPNPGGCAVEDKLPPGISLEIDSAFPTCPYYEQKDFW